jgi:cytochrome b pre-mRNA-processing protein 3
LGLFSRNGETARRAARLYAAAVAEARRPEFYLAHGVPDTVCGRFEMVALHVFLILHRLKGEGAEAAALAQALFDTMFADMDRNLRELGIGDMSVGREIRGLAESFYGRVAAYDRGLEAGGLALALRRNIFAGENEPGALALADYMRNAVEVLRGIETSRIVGGEVRFPGPPMDTGDAQPGLPAGQP